MLVRRMVLMSMDQLQESLKTIGDELKGIEERREKLLKGTRDVISLCSKSIVDQHFGKEKEAVEKITNAGIMLAEFRNYARDDLERYLLTPEQEFVEASILLSITRNSKIPSLHDLKVSGPAYVLGLLDSLGEIKRMVFDKIRRGMTGDARNLFGTMEEIYGLIYPFAIYDNLVNGIKRKLDVNKNLIEDVRALITEESRRESMVEAIKQLEARFASLQP
jgi:translin